MAAATIIQPNISTEEMTWINAFFDVYNQHYDQASEYTTQVLTNHPELGPLIKNIPKEEILKQRQKTLRLIDEIVQKDNWIPYIENVRTQGIMYAKMGLSFSTWFDALKPFYIYMTPILVKQYPDSKDYSAIVNAMHQFIGIAMNHLGEAYIAEKTHTIEQQKANQLKLIKELESFAYVISHDLKAPLRGISTLTEWIVQDYNDKLDDTGKESLGLLKNRVERMSNLIDGVLQYSRVGRLNMDQASINIKELLIEIVDLLNPPKHIKISLDDNLPVIKFNKTAVSQVFENLINNAIKYMDKPQGDIRITCDDNDDHWKFNVIDNGPGIDEKYFDKIFILFQTLSARDDKESTGIGLSIVKKIVENAGGNVSVESTLGSGSTFSFTISKQ